MGIDANWGGNDSVFIYADMHRTKCLLASLLTALTSATVFKEGRITTNVTAPGAKAMDVCAYGVVILRLTVGRSNAYSTGVYDVHRGYATAGAWRLSSMVNHHAIGMYHRDCPGWQRHGGRLRRITAVGSLSPMRARSPPARSTALPLVSWRNPTRTWPSSQTTAALRRHPPMARPGRSLPGQAP